MFVSSAPLWPSFTPVKPTGNYTLRLLRETEEDFNSYARFWRIAFPSLEGGGTDFILNPALYPHFFGRGKGFLKESYGAFVFEDENIIFGGSLLYMDKKNRAANALLMATLPGYRNNIKVGKFLYKFAETYDKFLEDSGVEYGWAAAVTTHMTTQKLLKHIGYKVKGVYLGWTVSSVNKVYYRRDNYVYMDKFYNGGDKRYPSGLKLIPEARRVYETVNKL